MKIKEPGQFSFREALDASPIWRGGGQGELNDSAHFSLITLHDRKILLHVRLRIGTPRTMAGQRCERNLLYSEYIYGRVRWQCPQLELLVQPFPQTPARAK